MIPWSKLNNTLVDAANRYGRLANKFAEFSETVAETAHGPAFHLKGMSVTLHPDGQYFDVQFLGHTVRFVFMTKMGDGETLMGTVQAYQVLTFPESAVIPLRSFAFKPSGQSDLADPEDGDLLHIDHSNGAMYIALNCIQDALH